MRRNVHGKTDKEWIDFMRSGKKKRRRKGDKVW